MQSVSTMTTVQSIRYFNYRPPHCSGHPVLSSIPSIWAQKRALDEKIGTTPVRDRTAYDHHDSSGNSCIRRCFAGKCGDLAKGRCQSATASRDAATPHDREEPITDLSKLRYARSQQRFFRKGKKFHAARHQEQQPFMQRAENLKR